MEIGRRALTGILGSSNWKKAMLQWLGFSLLCVTIPAVVGHYFKIIGATVDGPDSEELPEFGGNLVGFWRSGLMKFAAVFLPWVIVVGVCMGGGMLADHLTIVDPGRKQWSGPQLMAILTFLSLTATTAFLTPAIILRAHRSESLLATLHVAEISRIARAGGASYIPLGLFAPLAWFGMAMLAMTGIGALVIPFLTIILLMAHARWLGLYKAEFL